MCVAITLLSKSDRLLSDQRLFGSFERLRERKSRSRFMLCSMSLSLGG
jgi:hypothetical protein